MTLFISHLDDDFPSLDAKIQAFQNLILSLPLVHQYLLLYIMDMLGLFSMTKDKTRMDVSALAAVFAPVSIHWHQEEILCKQMAHFYALGRLVSSRR